MKAKEIIRKWRLPFKCTLMESIMSTEIELALNDWIKNTNTDEFVLIGGTLVGYYTKPRMTQDVDVLYISADSIPSEVSGFKHHRSHAFEHRRTGVEIETLDSKFLKIPQSLVDQVFKSSIIKEGVRIASVEGLIAMKTWRGSFQDIADIDSIIQIHDVDLSDWILDPTKLEMIEQKLGYKLRNQNDITR